MDNHMFAFKFHDFDYTQGPITLPEKSCWYRAYDTSFANLTHHPTFFGDMEVAFFYNRQDNKRLGEFTPKRPLRVLDIRYLRSLLPLIITKSNYHVIHEKATLAFGLCSFTKQIELLKKLYPGEYPKLDECIARMEKFSKIEHEQQPGWANSVELQGVRIGIGDIDFAVCLWLKDLLYPMIDGFIAPRMHSPFHDQVYPDETKSMMYEELMLFDPLNALRFVQDRPKTEKVQYFVTTGLFQQVISQNTTLWMFDQRPIRVSRHIGGGYTARPKMNDDAVERYISDKNFRKEIERLRRSWMPSLKKSKANHPIFTDFDYIKIKTIQPEETYTGTPKF